MVENTFLRVPRLTCWKWKGLAISPLCVPQCMALSEERSGCYLLSDWCPSSVWERWTDSSAKFLKMEGVDEWKTIILWNIEVKRTSPHERPLDAKEFNNSWIFQRNNLKKELGHLDWNVLFLSSTQNVWNMLTLGFHNQYGLNFLSW